MTEPNIKRISLDELIALEEAGLLPPNDPNATPGPDLPDEFWENAILIDYREPTTVTLTLDPIAFAWFKQHGTDPVAHMQAALRDYVSAQMEKKRRKSHPDAAE